jgi:uncharacterized protein (DUF1697 family)
MRHVALIRAVNVGGVPMNMETLRGLAGELGLADARTIVTSGNLVFSAERRKPAALEAALEKGVAERFDIRTDVIVRTAKEWQAVISDNPFPEEAAANPGHFIVMPMKSEPAPGSEDKLRAAIKGEERIAVVGRTLFIVYPDGIGRSKLTINVIDRNLGTRGTGRNWNTVLRIGKMLVE